MKKIHAMDLFGKALKAYSNGDRDKFYLKDNSGKLHEKDLSRYFRKTNQLSKSERKLISLSYGNILDVGCGTGHYIPILSKRGKTLGIDISKNAIEVAKQNGCKNCIAADFFTFKPSKKFDTITLIENNFGIGGSVNNTKKLLKRLSGMLNKNGQILAISKNISDRKYFISEIKPVWKGKIGPKFAWIHLNVNFLSDLCRKEKLSLKVIQHNQFTYLVKIVKK